ncbi:hypothetical protein NQ318_008135 [Aromia moschata]|uniref:DUF4817 domain-containing protein n=1 Tax=Aromia moschata TaxID=1265417 RepID=A0AAV8YN55_9CUCU|nr:hypothetical protein NQ318_008135 [Aromia moschata]
MALGACRCSELTRRVQREVVEFLFDATHPDRQHISQSMVTRVECKYREFGHVRRDGLSKSTLQRLVAKFETTGSVNNLPTPVRQRNARSAENIAAVRSLNTVTLGMFVIFLNLVDLQNQKKINLMFCWQYRKIITQHLTNWLLISIWQRPHRSGPCGSHYGVVLWCAVARRQAEGLAEAGSEEDAACVSLLELGEPILRRLLRHSTSRVVVFFSLEKWSPKARRPKRVAASNAAVENVDFKAVFMNVEEDEYDDQKAIVLHRPIMKKGQREVRRQKRSNRICIDGTEEIRWALSPPRLVVKKRSVEFVLFHNQPMSAVYSRLYTVPSTDGGIQNTMSHVSAAAEISGFATPENREAATKPAPSWFG